MPNKIKVIPAAYPEKFTLVSGYDGGLFDIKIITPIPKIIIKIPTQIFSIASILVIFYFIETISNHFHN